MKRIASTTFCELMSAAALAGVLMALGLCVTLWPSVSQAATVMGRCIEIGHLGEAGAHGFFVGDAQSFFADDAPSAAESDAPATAESMSTSAANSRVSDPCSQDWGSNSDADPSSNFCFEQADGQISTLPRLIAEWRGQKEAAAVVDSILLALDRDESAPESESELMVGPVLVSISPAAAPPEDPSDELVCSTNPEQCHSMPPLLILTEAVFTAVVRVPLLEAEIFHVEPSEPRAWAELRVGPQPGHRNLPEQPPRA
jgi:hypothetical protein